MQTFFHSWRRKIGGVILLLASVVTSAWIRSYTTSDHISFANGELAIDTLYSSDGSVFWNRLRTARPQPKTHLNQWASYPTSWAKEVSPFLQHVEWEWCGFGVIKDRTTDSVDRSVFDACFIPYWSITTPLTLLSAYLMLVPARKRSPSTRQPEAQ